MTFAVLYDVDFLNPSILDLVMYIRYMANLYSSPASTKNYLSGAKYWITTHGGNTSAFTTTEASEMIKAIVSESVHVPSPALPLSPHDICIICEYLDTIPAVIKAIKPCIWISYACMLRSSNVLSPSLTVWGGAHTLYFSDISLSHDVMNVVIRSTKSTSKRKPVMLRVLPSSNPVTCPIRAWTMYVRKRNPWPHGPAFVTDSGSPLTAGPVVSAMRAALAAAGVSNLTKISMHSLRRGAAQAAYYKGVPKDEIMKHGIWSTSWGLDFYLKPASIEVPRVLSSLAS